MAVRVAIASTRQQTAAAAAAAAPNLTLMRGEASPTAQLGAVAAEIEPLTRLAARRAERRDGAPHRALHHAGIAAGDTTAAATARGVLFARPAHRFLALLAYFAVVSGREGDATPARGGAAACRFVLRNAL